MTDKTGIFRANRIVNGEVVEGYYRVINSKPSIYVKSNDYGLDGDYTEIDPSTLEYLGGEKSKPSKQNKYGLEFRHNPPPSFCAEYEIVNWQGTSCYTVAIFRYNKNEPCWYLESVGDRIAGLNCEEFMREVNKGFECVSGKPLTEKGD